MAESVSSPSSIRKAIVASILLALAGLAVAIITQHKVEGLVFAAVFAGFASPPSDAARMFAVSIPSGSRHRP